MMKNTDNLVGKSIRALKNYPYGGNVKIGEVGVIYQTNSSHFMVNFPSQKGYMIYHFQLKDNPPRVELLDTELNYSIY